MSECCYLPPPPYFIVQQLCIDISFPTLFRAANIIITHLPEMRKGLLDALDMVFIPRQMASQVVLAVALETSLVRKYAVFFF